MIPTSDQQQVKALLTETIMLLCKNGLHFKSEFSIEGLIGITLDHEDVFLISIKETIKDDNNCIGVKTSGLTSTEQLKRISPTALRNKKHGRKNESNCTEALINSSDGCTDISLVSLDDSVQGATDLPNVKMEFSTPDQGEHCRSVIEESQACISVPVAIYHNSANQNFDDNVLHENVSSEGVHLPDTFEPASKRHCKNVVTALNESVITSDRMSLSDHQESPIFDSKVSKSEPIDVMEIQDDEMESALNSERSYLMYLSMCNGGGEEGIPSDAGYSTSYALSQMNQHPLPGCSSWSPVSMTVNFNSHDKVELIKESSVYVSSSLYQELEQEINPKASRLVRRLVHEIFPDERTLASSSCLGKRQSCCRGLDQAKVDAIKEYVLQRCPTMTHSDFVQTINIMCADARKSIRARIHRQRLAEFCRNFP